MLLEEYLPSAAPPVATDRPALIVLSARNEERLLEVVSFDAADRAGTTLTVDAAYVEGHLGALARDEDVSRYIL